MRINLGSHDKRIEGYVNVDILNLPNVDIQHDLTEFPYPFEDESIDEILMEEVLEHIGWRDTHNVLKEIHRILKPGGVLKIQVPDIREMMFNYWNGQICECVAHKPKTPEEGKAKLACGKCEGYGRVNPMRWKMAFLGAQKHDYDFHKNIFTPEILEEELLDAGFFRNIFGKDKFGWKIKVKSTK